MPGGFRVSLLALKAAGELFELEARVVVVKLTAKRWEFRVIPAAHIVQPKVPKPPRRSAGAANRTCAFMMCVGYWEFVRAAYDTCAGLCVGYAAVGLEPSKSSGRTAGWRLLGAVHVPSGVGALRCANSGRRRWLATHTLTRGRACASRGGRCGVQVASRQVVVPVRSCRSPTTNGISSRIERTLQGRSRVGRRAQGGSREGQVSPSQAGGAGPILDVGT